jgi:hypothetical protein
LHRTRVHFSTTLTSARQQKESSQPTRNRQLAEEAESNHCSFVIDFPIRALHVASSAFREGYKTSPDAAQVFFDMGNILPGYAMCVLDWLVRALSSNHWIEFLPPEAPVVGEDTWYWVYCYSAMRSLGMDGLAQTLRDFIMRLINIKTLIIDRQNYVCVLRVLSPWDALVTYLADRTAWQMTRQILPLSTIDVEYITTRSQISQR